jgi:hypothetical protein
MIPMRPLPISQPAVDRASAGVMASAPQQRLGRHDPDRPRIPASEAHEPVHEAADPDEKCLAGGLTVVMNMPLNQATTHFSLCLPCQQQFIRRSGLTAIAWTEQHS